MRSCGSLHANQGQRLFDRCQAFGVFARIVVSLGFGNFLVELVQHIAADVHFDGHFFRRGNLGRAAIGHGVPHR